MDDEVQDSWRQLKARTEDLGSKLKSHLDAEFQHEEAETPTDSPTEPTEQDNERIKAAFDELGQKLQDAFDAFGNAARDPEVRTDVKEIGGLLKEALNTTFTKAGANLDGSSQGAPEHPEEP